MNLSVVVITLNEERNIARCLDSVKDIADEIVVIDSFSTDKTQEICQKYQVKFITHQFEDYATQKNFAVSQATGDYILSMDADEQLSDTLKREIKAIKDKSGSQSHNSLADAYCFNRMTNYCGIKWVKHCGWYPDVATRLVRKDLASFQGAFVHEGIVLNSEHTVVHLHGDLLHYSYYTTEEHIARVNRYSTLGAKKYLAKGKKVSKIGIVSKTSWTFFRTFFLKLGFLDGFVGYRISKIAAFETFIKYVKVREFMKEK